ncbi:transcription initiation factor TFIID subunit 7 [Macrosteles quadrilineatus]|uniref:transcription initiation factor TFIID subunit 7 n=1 Tax=Macrosteles quadrilineatus TaxID=74068 RepID=UPI0023E2248F|nr:transcription initiation factor TFIID subunit 7 [Macrosteles quadrilineatus]
MNRNIDNKREAEAPAELESQFILRLPQEPAKALRELVRSGVTSLKDRLSIKIENDMRYGEVRMDHWLMHAKVLDLPTILESMKTIDKKSFYKTADICQIVICKEEDDHTTTDEESPQKQKKKDPNKVEKKFLWPHGITPPLKNVRKRRFRKTLKKKYVEAPEIEKEVKRLLRGDNEAVSVRWEVINEEDEKKANTAGSVVKEEPLAQGVANNPDSTQHSVDVAEHDIFGEAVSDSEDEDQNINILELEEENSRLTAEDSRLSDSASLHGTQSSDQQPSTSLVTEFTKEMFSPQDVEGEGDVKVEETEGAADNISYGYDMFKSELSSPGQQYLSSPTHQMSTAEIRGRMESLQQQLADLKVRRHQQELEIANIENYALRQRFQDILDNLLQEQLEKEQQYQELSSLL